MRVGYCKLQRLDTVETSLGMGNEVVMRETGSRGPVS